MEANSKLQKKKRIAHSLMSKSNFDEPKLPPDDFLYNIMRDMDSNDIMSPYQSPHKTKSKTIQETSAKRGQNQKNSNLNSYFKKQDGKYFSKKPSPLMQKCKTSLKYLKKNCCIPKPRAHVGLVPKPPKQPDTFAEPCISNSKTEKYKNSVKKTKVQSKAYSQVIESNLIRDNNIKMQPDSTTEKDLITQDNDIDCSTSDDNDAAYESFIKKTKEESKIPSDSDSDSRLTIRRKKSKLRQKRKIFKKRSISSDDNKNISKVTSIPLSDSSDSESEEAIEVNERLKHKKDISTTSHKQVLTNHLGSFQSDSSSDELPHLNDYNSSSEEDICATAAKNTEPATDFIDKSMPAMENSAEVSSLKLSSKSTHQQSDQSLASIPIVSITFANQPMINKNWNISKSNGIISSDSLTAESVQKCCVRLKRDPLIEQLAGTHCMSTNYSAVDCIIISDESDTEATTTSLPSNDSPSLSSNTQHKDTGIENSDPSNFEEIDECIITCELPKVGSSSKLNTIASHEKATISNDLTLTSSEINSEQSSNVSCESISQTIEEFKVQIVAVKSLVAQENSFIAKTEGVSDIELIDLSDDNLNFQNDECVNVNFEAVKRIDAEQPTGEGIQHSVSVVPFILNEQDQDSETLLSNPMQQSPCEKSPVLVQGFSNTKILEVLNKIDFDSIKEIINKTSSINSDTSIACRTMTNEQHTGKLSTDKPLPDFTNNFSKTDAAIQGINSAISSTCVVSNDMAMELTSKPNASKHIPFVNSGETTCTAKLNAELSNKLYVEEKNTSGISNCESSPIAIAGTENQFVTVCDNFQKTDEKSLIPVAMDSQLNSVKQIKVIDHNATIDNGENESLSHTINDKKRKKDIAIWPVVKKPKCEIFESPSDELDVIAASLTKDLSTPNKKVDALLNLYKSEYAKYMNIINTEANVTLGLKMLHNKQLEKLTHLRSSIKNLVKHDPCYHTVIQEKFDGKVQACIKKEDKLKQNISVPTSSSDESEISVHVKTDIEMNLASSAKESGREIPTHPKLEGKLTSSEDRQEAGTLAQSEVKKTTPREKFLKYMKNLKCAECGKPATARCQGCAQVFYCSSQCGVLSWKKGHNIACRRRM